MAAAGEWLGRLRPTAENGASAEWPRTHDKLTVAEESIRTGAFNLTQDRGGTQYLRWSTKRGSSGSPVTLGRLHLSLFRPPSWEEREDTTFCDQHVSGRRL